MKKKQGGQASIGSKQVSINSNYPEHQHHFSSFIIDLMSKLLNMHFSTFRL